MKYVIGVHGFSVMFVMVLLKLQTSIPDKNIQVKTLPENALHEIYGYLLENSFVQESEYKWFDSMAQEISNVENALKLRRFMHGLECVKHKNIFIFDDIKKYIPDENDWKNLNENPQAFEWKFRIFNSY